MAVHNPHRLNLIRVTSGLVVVVHLIVITLRTNHFCIVILVKQLVIWQRAVFAHKVAFLNLRFHSCEYISEPENSINSYFVKVVHYCAEGD